LHVRAARDAALADEHDVGRHLSRQPLRNRKVGAEHGQVTVVDADNACASAQRALELTLVMDFDERGDLSVTCCRKKSPETRVIQDSYDEENRIRASGTRFPDLLGRDHEILPQDRKSTRLNSSHV